MLQRFIFVLILKLESIQTKTSAKKIFFMGATLFVSLNLALNIVPMLVRSAPVEVDDAYTLISKASQMENCFFQDCPALNQLRAQLATEVSDPSIEWLRYREYKSTFLIWHPLYSILLGGFHSAGISWENSFRIVIVLGSLFLSSAISIWMKRIFGFRLAGISLLLSAIIVLQGYGFNVIVPNTWSLMIAVSIWSAFFTKKPISSWKVAVSILLMIAMHPIGRIFALVTIAVFIILKITSAFDFSRNDIISIIVSLILVAITFVLPVFIPQLELSLDPGPLPEDWQGFNGVFINGMGALQTIDLWFESYWPFTDGLLSWWGKLYLGGMIVYGYFSLGTHKQFRTKIMLGMLIAFSFASIVYVLANFPAYAFLSFWPLVVLLFTGFIANALWRLYVDLVGSLRRIIFSNNNLKLRDLDKATILKRGLQSSLVVIVFISLYQYGYWNLRNYFYTLESRITSNRIQIDNEHTLDLMDRANYDDSVLYTHEILMHYYLTHGAFDLGAIYFPVLRDSSLGDQWLSNNEELKYLVTWNPIHGLAKEFWPWEQRSSIVYEGALQLEKGSIVEIFSENALSVSSMMFYLDTPEGETVIYITADDYSLKLNLPSNYGGWYSVPEARHELEFEKVFIEVTQTSDRLQVAGLRIGKQEQFFWPWNQGIGLAYSYPDDPNEKTEVYFSTSNLVPEVERQISIINDSGSTILAEFLP